LLVFCQGLASILQSVLFARHSFVISSSGKFITNLSTIVIVAAGHRQFGIQAVVAGMLAGGGIQIVLLGWALSSSGFRYHFRVTWADPKLREILRSFRHPIIGHVFGESAPILQNILGSFIGSGSVTVLKYASRIVQAIAGMLLGSVVQVTFPLIAKHATTNDLTVQRKTLLESIQLLIAIGVPVCIWLILTAEPLMVFLFVRGRFLAADAILSAAVIQLMVPDILLGRVCSVMQTLFYAKLETRIPLVSTLIFTFANTVLATILSHVAGVLGIAIAVSLASLSNTIYMTWKLHTRFGPIGWGHLWGFSVRLAATCVIGGGGLFIGTRLATFTTVSHDLANFLALAMPTFFGICSFLVAACLFRLMNSLLLPIGRQAS
jgi:putative peptidoglycan lipid II flippase